MYGGRFYGGATYGGGDVADIQADTDASLAVEVSFTTGALEEPVWVDITPDVRLWDTFRGRNRELERFQPGRATVVLSNRERQYDSVNEDGPWFGYLKPMRRMRIRETFSGVTFSHFDGYVDRWQLDYPGTGKDATATLVATDGFKIHARADLPVSVYFDEVRADGPVLWWRLDDPQYRFAALDASGNGRTGTPNGNVRFGGETLIVNDPGGSLQLEEATDTNVEASLTLNAANPFAFEFWFKWDELPSGAAILAHFTSGGNADVNFQINPITLKSGFVYTNNAGGSFSAQPNFSFVVGRRYHIVCTHASDRVLRVFIDGAETPYDVQDTTTGATDLTLAAVGSSSSATAANRALVDEFAVYTTVPSDTRIGVHRGAGIAPWENDLPGDRIGRVLDETGWPDELREIDGGAETLQTAALNTAALEHLQKVAETEFGLLFMSADGKVRFVDRAAVLARVPHPATFGDAAGEVGYSTITFDDGDQVIRNRATISRIDGIARSDEDAASVTEFGRFDYFLDGLLHDTDQYSQDYAELIVAEYKDPRRRVTSLGFAARAAGEEADLAHILGVRLGDSVEVRNRPPGAGDVFDQTCVVEGIRHTGTPGGERETTWMLSPELSTNTALDLLVTEGGDPIETEDGIDLEV